MRVGLVIFGSLETISGGYLYDRKLVEYLQGEGDRVDVISIPWRRYSRQLADNFSSRLYRRFVELDVDVLLQDELCHASLFGLNRRLRRWVSYPLVSIVHHLRSSEDHPPAALWLYRRVEHQYLRTVDGFVFNSETTCRSVELATGADMPSVIAYPAGQFQPEISPEEILARSCEPGPLRVLFVGSLIPRKGLHTLLAALEMLPPGAVTLTIAGGALSDSRYGRGLRLRMKASRQASSIHLTGVLPEVELAGLMRRQQLLAVPSSYEGYGIVYLEGMGFGLPAIATTSGAAGEVIRHGENGCLIPPGDPASLAEAILRLHHDREKLSAMSLAARQSYLEHPGWEQAGAAIRAFIEHISQEKNSRASRHNRAKTADNTCS